MAVRLHAQNAKNRYTLGAEPEVPKGLASHTWIFSSLSEATLTPDLADGEQVANKLHHTILFTPHAIPHQHPPQPGNIKLKNRPSDPR